MATNWGAVNRKQLPVHEPRLRLSLSVVEFRMIVGSLDRSRVTELARYSGLLDKMAAVEASERWSR